jgi:hypothetical protein
LLRAGVEFFDLFRRGSKDYLGREDVLELDVIGGNKYFG